MNHHSFGHSVERCQQSQCLPPAQAFNQCGAPAVAYVDLKLVRLAVCAQHARHYPKALRRVTKG